MHRAKGLFVLDPAAFEHIYGPELAAEIGGEVDLVAAPQTAASVRTNPGLLADVEVIFTGWGMAKLDSALLAAAPKLAAVFYGAGAVGYFATPESFDRGVVITSASAVNAIPVAEYTLATVLFSLKSGWLYLRNPGARRHQFPLPPGAYRSTVGLCSMGLIARLVLEHLRRFELNVIAYDPYLSDADAAKLGVTKLTLPELFLRSDVVSLHTPGIPSTRGMIDRTLLASMKPGATLINTARGSVVNEADLANVLAERPDLQAVLDVTDPEPPAADSPLLTLPNVVLTPHIAGSVGPECRRMGRMMLEEFRRWRDGQPLLGRVTPQNALHTAHGLSAS